MSNIQHPKSNMGDNLMEKIVSLCKRRGFVFPGSEIYGGLANAWDYGPYGVLLKNNIKAAWWQKFVLDRDDMVGLDAALLMNTKVYEASGHLKEFSDPLVECKACHERFRADQIDITAPCPACRKGQLTEAKQFNLMLKTFLGPVESPESVVYFRPETAQGIFVNFKNLTDTMRLKLPFGVGQIGKAFRNEITPGNFIFRTREFEQMEVEYFFAPDDDWKNIFENWQKIMHSWIDDLGLNAEQIHEVDVEDGQRAHYSQKTIDFEYDFPFGRKELFGLAYRTNFDLKNHNLNYTTDDGQKIIPHCIEPSLGVDRSMLALLCSAYTEEELENDTRIVLKLPIKLAPIKVAIFPLLKNKPPLVELAKNIFHDLKKSFVCEFDDNGNVGKRYRRQDEIGTPFCITIDFDSLEKQTVTVRERDTMKQEIIEIEKLKDYLTKKLQ